jgi:hypothetical protein
MLATVILVLNEAYNILCLHHILCLLSVITSSEKQPARAQRLLLFFLFELKTKAVTAAVPTCVSTFTTASNSA